MKKALENYSIQFIKEIIPVTVGILIALFIDNWNTNRKDQVYINQVFSTIKSELNETTEEIKYNIPLQNSYVDSLEYYADNKSVNILDITMKCKGVFIPQIKTSAWKSVSTSKIDLINYDKITSLSNIEEQKDILKNKTEFLMNFLYSNFYETEKNKKETIKILILDIIQTEKTIQRQIDFYNKK